MPVTREQVDAVHAFMTDWIDLTYKLANAAKVAGSSPDAATLADVAEWLDGWNENDEHFREMGPKLGEAFTLLARSGIGRDFKVGDLHFPSAHQAAPAWCRRIPTFASITADPAERARMFLRWFPHHGDMPTPGEWSLLLSALERERADALPAVGSTDSPAPHMTSRQQEIADKAVAHLGLVGHRMTADELLDAIGEPRDQGMGREVLAEMVKRKKLTTTRRKTSRGSGYGLPEWGDE
jgi:hypothetical protein